MRREEEADLESESVSPRQLLDELRRSYQTLSYEGRMQVAAYLSELSLGQAGGDSPEWRMVCPWSSKLS